MTITERITNILKFSHASRNSDKALWLIYAQKSGANLTPAQIKVIKNMPSFETLRRTRQQQQMQGKYPADDKTNEMRYRKFKEVRSNIKYDDPEKLLEAQGIKILPWGK